jgi:hypothetical protein
VLTFVTKEVENGWKFFIYKDKSIVLGVGPLIYKNDIQCTIAARNYIYRKYGIRWAVKEKTHELH